MFASRGFVCRSILMLLALPGIAPHMSAGEPAARVDEVGDPLPPGTVARIGTVRLRQPSEVCSVVFSPDGKLLATGGRYDGVRLWDSTTGKLLRFIPAKAGQGIFHLAFAPDGKTLVSSGTDGALEVWAVAAGKRSRLLVGKSVRLGPLCFSDDGKLLAVAAGKTMRVWETADWTEREHPQPDEKKVVLNSFAGKRMYVGNEKGEDFLWDLAAQEKQVVPRDWRMGCWTALSPDGKRLAASDSQAALVVQRDIATGKESHRLELAKKKDDDEVNALCYSPDGKRLAIGGRGIPMLCIDSETGKVTATFGDQEARYNTKLAFSRDGKRLAAACGHAVRLWEVGTGKELLPARELLQSVRAIAFSPNGKRLVFGDGESLRLYDLAARKQVWRYPEDRDYTQRTAFAPDGKTLVAGNIARLRFHDALTGKVTHSWGKGFGRSFEFDAPIELGLFTPDLEKVVSLQMAHFGDPDTDVHVLSARTGKELFKFQRHSRATTAASISPNGLLLAIGNRHGPTQVYNITSGKSMAQLDAAGTDWHSLVFGPDGRTAASMATEGSLQLLEAATGKTRLVLPRAEDRDEFVFSPDGKILAIWSKNTVNLWDTLTGRKLGRLEGHNGRINQAAFAPGGRILATAGEDATILLWDLAALVREEKPTTLTPEALTAAWKDLADPNPAQACLRMASFRQAGPQAVEFLRDQLRPEQMPAAKQIDRWLKDLDHDQFTVREEATRELEKHLDVVAPALRKALAAGPSPEVRRSLTQLIELAEEGRWAPESLRTLRAIEVLEHIGSEEARTALETLAGGAPEARLTREAKASLERLAR
jgi:WD40 repeat protein